MLDKCSFPQLIKTNQDRNECNIQPKIELLAKVANEDLHHYQTGCKTFSNPQGYSQYAKENTIEGWVEACALAHKESFTGRVLEIKELCQQQFELVDSNSGDICAQFTSMNIDMVL